MIELRKVKKVYATKIGEVNALDEVSLIFPEKGLVFITGKSGSGKTTMLNVIGGLDGFDSGEIIVDGKSFSDLTAKDYDSYRNTFIGVVFQEYNLLPEYTVEKNINIATELQGAVVNDEELTRLMTMVGIEEFKTRLPSELSGGQMQRVAIARALIKNPHIILADEPTGALDSATGIQVIETLKELSKQKLVIIVSHDLELAEKYADRIITLKDGKIIDDVEVSDVTVEGNLHQGKVLCVRSGADLTSEEKDIVIEAVKQKQPIEVIDSITVREKSPTKKIESDVKDGKEIQLISSKMKFKSVAELGVKSLKVKPFRLIITILLSVIAFGLFGVFDSVAAYNEQKVLFYNLKDSGFNSVVIDANYKNKNGDEYTLTSKTRPLKISQSVIDEINNKTGYQFKGITYVSDNSDSVDNVGGEHVIKQLETYSFEKRVVYYSKRINGAIEFDNEKLTTKTDLDEYGNSAEYKYITENGFNLKILHGEYPSLYDAEGNFVPENVKKIGISKYIAESIMNYCDGDPYDGAKITNISSLIGAPFTLDETTYTIACIIDCGDIPERYLPLRDTDENKLQALAKEYKSFLASSTQLNIFRDEGAFEYELSKQNRVPTYYSPDSKSNFAKVEGINPGHVYTGLNMKWFAVDDIPEENRITFDSIVETNNGKTVYKNVAVKQNEVLVNAYRLTYLFTSELGVISATDKLNGFNTQDALFRYANVIKYATKYREYDGEKLLFPSEYDIKVGETISYEYKRKAMNDFLKIIQDYVDPHNSGTDLGTKVISKDVTFTQKFIDSQVESEENFKIVGVYFDIENNNKDNWIFALNKSDMDRVGAYNGQGHYIRAVSPINLNAGTRQAMSVMMTKEDGLQLSWYRNTIIEELTKSAFDVQAFFEIFVYIDIVLAFFAVFMLSNYITTSIIQKRQTIGILRALGSNGNDIFKIFIIESLVIAVLSGVFAIGFGMLGCSLVNFYINNYMAINVSFAIFEVRQGLLIFLSSVLTSLIASLIPIIRTCKRKPVELIRKSL